MASFPAQNRGMGTLYSGDILCQVLKLLLDAVLCYGEIAPLVPGT